MKTLLFMILFVISIACDAGAQSVYVCAGTNVYVRETNCTSATSFGQVSTPQSFVVTNTTAWNCNHTWYQIDIPTAHNIPGYPTTAYVASEFFTKSSSPDNYLIVQNISTGLKIKNSQGGAQTWIYNSGHNFEWASFENGEKLARTSTPPVMNGSDTWYEVYLTPNCYNNNSTGSGVRTTGWVSDGVSTGGPYVIPYQTFPPILSVSPINQPVSSSFGSTSFVVSNTGSGTLSYTSSITTGSDWLTYASGQNGGNGGTITVNYQQNPNTTSRTAYIQVTAAGANGSPQTVTVTQAAAEIPILSVTPDNQPVSASSGSTSFTVSNTGSGSMTYTSSITIGNDWLTYSSGQNGGNSGIINFNYSQNVGTMQRSATIRITAIGANNSPTNVTVVQEGNVVYVLKNSLGQPFQLRTDAWQFSNSGDLLWPKSWWNQFDYSAAPYPVAWQYWPISAKPQNFPDWPLFVEAFGESQCYWAPPPGIVIYNPKAVAKWAALKDSWIGSCFGFAITSYLYFDKRLSVADQFPGISFLRDVPISDQSRKLINKFWIYQFGQSQQEHIEQGLRGTTPTSTLAQIKNMMTSPNQDDRILVFWNQGKGGGGHAVNPYRVGVGTNYDSVYIYDNNFPSAENYILFDKTANNGNGSWNYPIPSMSTWGGNQGIFLMEPVSDYLQKPMFPRTIPSKEKRIYTKTGTSDYFQCFLSDSSDVEIRSRSGTVIGYLGNKVMNTLVHGHPIIPITGHPQPPIGYYLPKEAFDVTIKNSLRPSTSLTFLQDSIAYSVRRDDVNNGDIDIYKLADGVKVINSDAKSKYLHFDASLLNDSTSKTFALNNVPVVESDSVSFGSSDDSVLIVQSFNVEKKYDLKISLSSPTGTSTFEHRNIVLPRNESHKIIPKWDSLETSLTIVIANNAIGERLDSITVENRLRRLSVAPNLNLVSLPVIVDSTKASQIYPTSTSEVLGWGSPGIYVKQDTLSAGVGYWIKFLEAQEIEIYGSAISSDTLTLRSGWNLIGSISTPVAVSQLRTNTPGFSMSQVFDFNNSYYQTDTLYPGRGHWVKTNRDGDLIISAIPMDIIPRVQIIPIDEFPPLPPTLENVPINEVPDQYSLDQNYPNPFNPSTVFHFSIGNRSYVRLTIFNVLGQVVKALVDGVQGRGAQSVNWNSIGFSSGVYFYRLDATSISDPTKHFSQTRKMLLVK